MTNTDWSHLQIGDEVGVDNTRAHSTPQIKKVTGLTKLYIKVDCDKFRKTDGIRVPDVSRYHSTHLMEANKAREILEKQRFENESREVRKFLKEFDLEWSLGIHDSIMGVIRDAKGG